LDNDTAGNENSPCDIFYQKSGRDYFWGSKARTSECGNDIFETFVFNSGSETEGFCTCGDGRNGEELDWDL